MSAYILVVDDAPDVESLFRQQFRRGAFNLTRAALRRAPPVTQYASELVENDGVPGRARSAYDF